MDIRKMYTIQVMRKHMNDEGVILDALDLVVFYNYNKKY